MGYLVHLGSGNFCVARFFRELCEVRWDLSEHYERFAVFTGVEVERSPQGWLRMVKHKS